LEADRRCVALATTRGIRGPEGIFIVGGPRNEGHSSEQTEKNPFMAVSAPRKKQSSPYHKGLNTSDILEAALKILQEGDLEDLTLARVAKELGVSAPAVYHHFPNKDALVAATAALGFRHLTALYEKINRTHKDLHSWIRARGRTYLQFAFEEPGLHRLMYRYRFADRQSHAELMEAENACYRSSVSQITNRKEQKTGEFLSHHSFRDFPVSMTIWSTFHGLATLIADGHMKNIPSLRTIDKMANDIADVLTKKLDFDLVSRETSETPDSDG
jgi:AcrR family transcriptional regulator